MEFPSHNTSLTEFKTWVGAMGKGYQTSRAVDARRDQRLSLDSRISQLRSATATLLQNPRMGSRHRSV